MAPLPPAHLPLSERLLALAKTLQFVWFSGHLVLLLCIMRYMVSFATFNVNSSWAYFTYRLSFLSAALTYGVVVYKTWRSRQKLGTPNPSVLGHLGDENVQYLLLALFWLILPKYTVALFPYGIYSVFHVATYTRNNLMPTIFPNKTAAGGKPQGNALSDALGSFVKNHYDESMSIVSRLEIAIWTRVLLSAVFFRSYSWILLAVYTAFLRARYAHSGHAQRAFRSVEIRIDSVISAQGIPPVARSIWEGLKAFTRQFYAATELSKYTSGPRVAKKET